MKAKFLFFVTGSRIQFSLPLSPPPHTHTRMRLLGSPPPWQWPHCSCRLCAAWLNCPTNTYLEPAPRTPRIIQGAIWWVQKPEANINQELRIARRKDPTAARGSYLQQATRASAVREQAGAQGETGVGHCRRLLGILYWVITPPAKARVPPLWVQMRARGRKASKMYIDTKDRLKEERQATALPTKADADNAIVRVRASCPSIRQHFFLIFYFFEMSQAKPKHDYMPLDGQDWRIPRCTQLNIYKSMQLYIFIYYQRSNFSHSAHTHEYSTHSNLTRRMQ